MEVGYVLSFPCITKAVFTCFIALLFLLQESASQHVSIISSDSDFPDTFDRCGDENCPAPCEGNQFHCSLCPKTDRKPIPKQCKLKEHFQKSHWDHKITREDKVMLKCILPCSTSTGKTLKNRGHWHCCYCARVFERESAMTVHLSSHLCIDATASKPTTQQCDSAQETPKEHQKVTSSGCKLVCPECSKCYPNKKALQRHIRDQHKRKMEAVVSAGRYLKGICVDFEKGIFLISRTFSGTMHPIHCQHKTNWLNEAKPVSSACEVNECLDAARVASRSGHPAFECVHLQSVQYARPFEIPVSLHEESLEEIVGGRFKWFTAKQKDMCLSHRKKATETGSPLVVRFPNDEYGTHSCRTVYFSVYDGGIHYWSRFGQVVVSYDSQTFRWSCACCRGKVSCLHKAVSKWFLYREDSALLGGNTDANNEDLENSDTSSEEDNEDDFAISQNLSVYPPSEKSLEDMVIYQLEDKKIPSNLPRNHLTMDVFPSALVPKEVECKKCTSPLSGPYKITSRAVIIAVTKVYTADVSTFYKTCNNCQMVYRYQEIDEGLHNFDDRRIQRLEELQLFCATHSK